MRNPEKIKPSFRDFDAMEGCRNISWQNVMTR